jgi:hypothetical protein
MLKTSQKLLQFGLSSLAAVTLGSVYCDRSDALPGFTGGYDFNNFIFSNNGANTDGSVNTINAATGTVILTGGDNGSGDPGTTDWVIPIDLVLNPNQEGSGSFDWSYESLDIPGNDEAGFLINNVFSFLSNTDGDSSIVFGKVNFTVDNTFTSLGLRVSTFNTVNGNANTGGAGVLTISNFNFVPVPFEFSPALGLVSLGALAVYKSLRKKK